MAVDWSYYDNENFTRAEDMYLPARGEGDTLATQLMTAAAKLIYKWYNDGDVYDNTHYLQGWANDLSSYANWIYQHIPQAKRILQSIAYCENDSDYEDLLKDLADSCLDLEDLENLNNEPKSGSIYHCDGPFEFREDEEDEDEEWY